MYSTHNEGQSVVGERFIRTLKNKIYKHMTSWFCKKYINYCMTIIKFIRGNLIECKNKVLKI